MKTIDGNIDERTTLTSNNRLELLLFRLGSVRPNAPRALYGINVFKIREIATMPEVTPIAGSAAHILGAVDIRGQIIPVIDLASLIGTRTEHAPAILLVTEFSRGTQAFAVEEVEDIVRLEWNQVLSAESSGTSGYVTGIARLGGADEQSRLAQILDVEQVMRDVFPEQHEDVKPADVGAAVRASSGSILAVDDSGFARALLDQALTALQAPHMMASNGEMAWQMLLKLTEQAEQEGVPVRDKVSLVVTDLEMPEMDGFTLTRKIKADDRLRHIPVLIHSSLTGEANETHARNTGANGYIAKFSPAELSAAIRDALAA
ncbi:chemotaxis protein [Burkholderia gladioli]|jgi:two-component system chemotaxis response regulator CheV|uniref:Chemotaxis protein n=1 Tax=Burkholderia gladioli TaxID=28095 RepID=A0AB38U544_BURGA|nr:chemotaxis protein [Burkholderia gladioli]KAF1059349.1 Chemotaxis protein CheV [Burkholderia gladioli]KKJ07831.1 chemotaxis protein CheV [Burkholderia gladioli]MBA1362448.1 chemotaxis protein CheV [Burkholderia gladioli]MBU9685662.1 chemotaxis protein [Burkholderia gladioli]MDD1785756.1 chemotaxis protein [Burkholderia gladioli]